MRRTGFSNQLFLFNTDMFISSIMQANNDDVAIHLVLHNNG